MFLGLVVCAVSRNFLIILYRCDQKDDCMDESDERSCGIIHVNNKYLKDKHPPPTSDDQNNVVVHVDVDIIKILLIDEVCRITT